MPISFSSLFERPKPLIAMIHTGPSPGMPGFIGIQSVVERAIAETEVYLDAGIDGILIENMYDFPCVHEREMGPEVAACMTRVAHAVKRRARYIPVGLHILFQGNKTALAVAQAAGCDFIRAEGWTHAHVSDKGVAEASAGSVLRYRHHIGAHDIPVFADIKKKHAAHALTADLGIADIARGMALHQADAVIVTGSHTGEAPDPEVVLAVGKATDLPLLIGSGTTPENYSTFYPHVEGFIVGSALKEGGRWNAPVCEKRVQKLVTTAEQVRAVHQAELMKN
ncbi:MAG: BtpA/SgcQ family protein [Rhodothermales bacterium]